MVNVVGAMGYGAAGGCVIGFVALFADVTDWQSACRESRSKGEEQPGLLMYVLPGPDGIVLVLRAVLGAVAGLAFHPQVTGAAAAIAVGASAPGLFRQLGSVRSVQEAVQGPAPGAAAVEPAAAVPLPQEPAYGAPTIIPHQPALQPQPPAAPTGHPPPAVHAQEGGEEDGS